MLSSLLPRFLGSFFGVPLALNLDLLSVCMILAALCGVYSHIDIFLEGEHHMQAPRILRTYSIAFLVVISLLVFENEDVWRAIKTASSIASVYLCSLGFSITLRRLYFHPLRGFPGPALAKVSKIWHAVGLISKPNYLLLDELHQQYGDFVRTGPNELSIRTPEAMTAVHGQSSGCIKAPFYDLLLPRRSIVTTRDRNEHDKRRRIWEQAFSLKGWQKPDLFSFVEKDRQLTFSKVVADYEQTIIKHCCQLEDILRATAEQVIDVSTWFHHFAFDVMGELAFGKSFRMLTSTENHYIIRLLKDGMTLLGLISPLPWLGRIGFAIPGLANGWKRMFRWSDEQMQKRLENGSDKADITSWLIDAMPKDDKLTDYARDWLYGDGFSIIIAGSDTTSSALQFLFYHLACHPEHVEKIRAETDELEKLNAASLLPLQYLNAVISETLRLHPPVPSAGLRQAPPEGISISGRFIPGGTTIAVPLYSLQRRKQYCREIAKDANRCLVERCFERPLDFVPERWCDESAQKNAKDAFAPFLRGRYGCVGRNLALMELRLVTASITRKFDIGFERGSDRGEKFLKSAKDHFTVVPGKLHLVFKRRG